MPVGFKCEVCNYSREVPDDYAGRKIRCPQCAAAVDVPAFAGAGSAAIGTPAHSALPAEGSAKASPVETRPCPFCAEPIKVEARKCRWCGEIVDRHLAIAKQQEKVKEVERKRELLYREAPAARGSLIIGIVGLIVGPATVFGGFALGPIAIVMAIAARRAIQKEPRLEGRGMATAGLVLGIITIVGTIVMLITNVRLLGHGIPLD